MLRIAGVVVVAGLLVGCGGQETETGAPGEGMPSVSASGERAAGRSAAAGQSQSCIDLVAEGKFRAALPICMEAVEADPANEELRSAANRAKSEIANLEAAAEEAKATASKAAASASVEAGKQASADLDEARESLRQQLAQ